MIGKLVGEFVPVRDLLTYTEAIMRVYNQYGRRDNKYKARIKILVHELKLEEFRARVDAEFANIQSEGGVPLDEAEVERVAAFFTEPDYETLENNPASLKEKLADNKDFSFWYKQNVEQHKKSGYAIVSLSLKKTGIPPGDATDSQMHTVADLSDEFSMGEIRTTHEQNVVFADVKQEDLYDLWQKLVEVGFASPNIGTLQDIICCPGLDFCALANARSIPIAEKVGQYFDDMDYLYDLGELKLKISGCINACGHHHVGHIGVLGVDKKGVEHYQLTLGGDATETASVGRIVGRALSQDEVVPALDKIIGKYLEIREEEERFLDTYRRVGHEPFKAVYENLSMQGAGL